MKREELKAKGIAEEHIDDILDAWHEGHKSTCKERLSRLFLCCVHMRKRTHKWLLLYIYLMNI